MCGIVGYIGAREAYPIIINGLKRLEYRGYDSAGIAVLGPADGEGAPAAFQTVIFLPVEIAAHGYQLP